VSGRVQGVFFRNWTVAQAEALGITGTVRNRSDGAVEIDAFGEAAALQALVDRCHQGPSASRVESVVVEEIEGEPPARFARAPSA
jgi:acylphosphatase